MNITTSNEYDVARPEIIGCDAGLILCGLQKRRKRDAVSCECVDFVSLVMLKRPFVPIYKDGSTCNSFGSNTYLFLVCMLRNWHVFRYIFNILRTLYTIDS
jgi:hypothetical protein